MANSSGHDKWSYTFFFYFLTDTVLIVRITLNWSFQAAMITRAREFQNFLLQKSHFFSLHSFREAFNFNLRKLQLTILLVVIILSSSHKKWIYALFTLSITKLTKSFSTVFAIFTFWSFCTTTYYYVLCDFYYKYYSIIKTCHNFCLKIFIVSTDSLMKILKNPKKICYKNWFTNENSEKSQKILL